MDYNRLGADAWERQLERTYRIPPPLPRTVIRVTTKQVEHPKVVRHEVERRANRKAEVLKMLAQGLRGRDIAITLGLTPAYVSMIKTGRA